MKDPNCKNCIALTSGDCGQHNPTCGLGSVGYAGAVSPDKGSVSPKPYVFTPSQNLDEEPNWKDYPETDIRVEDPNPKKEENKCEYHCWQLENIDVIHADHLDCEKCCYCGVTYKEYWSKKNPDKSTPTLPTEEEFMTTPPECRVCGYNHEPDCDTKATQEPMEWGSEWKKFWKLKGEYPLDLERKQNEWLNNLIKQAEERERHRIIKGIREKLNLETMSVSSNDLDDVINIITNQ